MHLAVLNKDIEAIRTLQELGGNGLIKNKVM